MTPPAHVRVDPLFRDEAVQWARGSRLGDPARLSSRATARLYWLLVALVMAAALMSVLVQVPTTAHGTAAVDFARGQFTAILPTGVEVGPGNPITLFVEGEGGHRRVTVAEVTRSDDLVVLTGEVPFLDGPPRAGRVDVHTGTTSLLQYLLVVRP
jgi:hypothetical protein